MKIIVVALLLGISLAEYSKPTYSAFNYKSGDYAHPYYFAYTVQDDPSHNYFGHQENSDGKVVSGSYRVLLPDKRIQIVNYKVDGYSGYIAQVSYEGEAKYPEYEPIYTTAAGSTYKPDSLPYKSAGSNYRSPAASDYNDFAGPNYEEKSEYKTIVPPTYKHQDGAVKKLNVGSVYEVLAVTDHKASAGPNRDAPVALTLCSTAQNDKFHKIRSAKFQES